MSLRNPSNSFENISIFVYLSHFNLCMCMITHIVLTGIPENFNQEYVNIVPAIIIFLAAFICFFNIVCVKIVFVFFVPLY